MKVYIVTCGEYSDYYIDRVFTDRTKAEEYREWRVDANDIEEYEVDDGCVVDKYYHVIVSYTFYAGNRYEKPTARIEKCNVKCLGYASVSNYNYPLYSSGHVSLRLSRYIPEANWNEEFYTNRYIKAIYDLAAQAKQLLLEGWTDRQINEMWNKTLADEENSND
jgi:hypothetical protein